jgi:SAM-dependent methyltransferase
MKNHSVSTLNTYNYSDYCEAFFKDMKFESVDTMDNSSYEGASIIHNLNMSIPLELKGQYGYIFDGGTSEHVFNIPQVYENIIDLLTVDGIVCSVVPNNNFSGHGMYQFSPEFFLSAFKPKYGMQLLGLYIGRKDTNHTEWINVNDVHHSRGGRNCSRFYDNEEVYIISIAKKTSDERCSLTIDPPNQYSYEEIVWKNTK